MSVSFNKNLLVTLEVSILFLCISIVKETEIAQVGSSTNTAQKMKFSIKDFFSKCDQIYSFLRFWSHLLKKSLMENFVFCAVKDTLFVPIRNKVEKWHKFLFSHFFLVPQKDETSLKHHKEVWKFMSFFISIYYFRMLGAARFLPGFSYLKNGNKYQTCF